MGSKTLKIAYALTRVYKFFHLPNIPGVLIVIRYEDQIVLVRHTYGIDDWQLPGGFRVWFKHPGKQAHKEICQELGVCSIELEWLMRRKVNGRKIDFYLGELNDFSIIKRSAELAEVGFFRESQLPADLTEAPKVALRQIGWQT